MNAQEIRLVQNSFREILPIADHAAALFYARLFELDPSLRALFHGGMQEQGRKLMTVLGTAVASLDQIEHILPTLRELGLRHARSGVHESHYATVGTALLWSLEKGLGEAFTPPLHQAWKNVYATLSRIMIEAVRIEMLAKLPLPARPRPHAAPGLAAIAVGLIATATVRGSAL